ncbi:MAG: thioesterase family protein [Kiritimatiellales bacterium]|nr:thioesterase family protein [Kiritimatiellales bacterium]
MARVKIELPETFAFSTELDVRITDINYGNHMGNDAVLSIIHEARLRFLKSRGFSEMDFGGCGSIMLDSVIVYKSQAFHGDRLKIEMAATDFNRLGCDIVYRISNIETGKDVAHAKTGIAAFDYEKQRIVPLPAAFRAAME